MGLGTDHTICKTEFVEAMRARLASDRPELGDTVDKPGAQKNLGAFGLAVYRIATSHAEVVSEADTDAQFWQWFESLENWASEISDWQRSLVKVFANWEPSQPADEALKEAILRLPNPGAPPRPPHSLTGRIQ